MTENRKARIVLTLGLWVAGSILPLYAQTYTGVSISRSQPQSNQAATNNSKTAYSDASIRSIAFVTPDQYIAVGDNGTILQTRNTGRIWESVDTPSDSHLQCVTFFGEQEGLAAGGQIGNYSGTSRGTLLHTLDGGVTWKTRKTDLPRILGMANQDGRLIAWGDYDVKRGTSVFQSTDRGKTWQAVKLPLGHAKTAAVAGATRLLAFDRTNNAAQVDLFNNQTSEWKSRLSTRVRSLHFTGESWIATGENGLLISSLDGKSWKPCASPLSQPAHQLCDWKFIHQVENEIWVCGSPGSVLLKSRNRGQSWELKSTNQSVPLNEIRFIDPSRGIAVGSLGTILATRDGGENWYRQRGNASAAVLAFSEDATKLPWNALIATTWESQATTVAVTSKRSSTSDLLDFLPAKDQQIADSGRSAGVHMARCLPSHADLAIALATWNPTVVLCDADRAQQFLALLDAVSPTMKSKGLLAAPELAQLPTLLKELKLQKPRIDKVVAKVDASAAQYSEQNQRVLSRVGLTIWDILLKFPPDVRKLHPSDSMHTVWSRSANRAAQAELLGAVNIRPDQEHELRHKSTGNYQLVMGRTHRRKTLQRLTAMDRDHETWVQDYQFLLKNLPAHEVAPLLVEISQQLESPEKAWQRDIFLDTLTQQNLHRDAAVWAMVERLRVLASDEYLAWLGESGNAEPESSSKPVAIETQVRDTSKLAQVQASSPWDASPFAESGADPRASQPHIPIVRNEDVVFASVEVAASSDESTDRPRSLPKSSGLWFELYNKYTQIEPRLLHRPDLQLLRFRVSQKRGAPLTANNQNPLETVLTSRPTTKWHGAALQELNTQLPIDQKQDLKFLVASRATSRPQLDGVFNESFWQQSKPMTLRRVQQSSSARQPTELRFAYDKQYFYIAMTCPVEPGARREPVKARRTFDANLDLLDHIQLHLDSNRDYNSTVALEVAENGETADSCLSLPGYNPKWHVFVGHQQNAWVAEIAVDMKFLSTSNPYDSESLEAWAISAGRKDNSELQEIYNGSQATELSPEFGGLLYFSPE